MIFKAGPVKRCGLVFKVFLPPRESNIFLRYCIKKVVKVWSGIVTSKRMKKSWFFFCVTNDQHFYCANFYLFFYALIPDAPEIEQEETFVHTREGDTTEVICVVHSSPRAEVKWYKNGLELDPSLNQIQVTGNRHVLTLPVTTEASFGQYMCRATNDYGESQKTTEVSGKDSAIVRVKDHE